MRRFSRHEGLAAPLRLDNLDTDVIIPMDALLSEPRSALGRFAFQPLRYTPDGTENAGFVLNRPAFRGASILVAGRNFGCGSSREGAVHALEGLGVRVVIAQSFGDIFVSNAFKNGLLPISLPADAVEALMRSAEGAQGRPFQVDLEAGAVTDADGMAHAFAVDSAQRRRLLQGKDEIARTLRYADAIAAFQARDRAARPWVWALEGAGR